MEQQSELKRQNSRLDKIEVALGNLHHVSKAVGDELDEQITLIEKLEENTERAQMATKKLHKNLKTHTLQGERTNNTLLNILLIVFVLFMGILVVYVLFK